MYLCSKKLVPEIACYVDEDTAMAGLVSIDYGIAIMPRITALSYYNVHILKIKNTIPPLYLSGDHERQGALSGAGVI